MGQECINWINSLIPQEEITSHSFGGIGSMIDGNDDCGSLFDINSYGQTLQPAITKEMEEKMSKKVE